jgi:hypothetical protein
MFQKHNRAADARAIYPYLQERKSFTEIAEITGLARSRCYRAAQWLEQNSLPDEEPFTPMFDDEEDPDKAVDYVSETIANAELTVPFSNWLENGKWVREAPEPEKVYAYVDDEQVLINVILDPGVMWPKNWDGAKTYTDIVLENVPEPRKTIKAGYILTSIQESTPLHGPAWINISALAAARGHYAIGLGGFTYKKRWFTKLGGGEKMEIAPWPSLVKNLVTRKRFNLHKRVQFASEMNISPTAVSPLTGLNSYIDATCTVFPHTKRAVESIPRGSYEEPIHTWTTGAVSVPNYVLQKAGLKALKAHTIGCVIVEIDTDDNVFIRNVDCDPQTGELWDLDLHVDRGVVRPAKEVRADYALPGPVLGLGCIHRRILNEAHGRGVWGLGGMPSTDDPIIDAMDASAQVFNDMLDGQSINHHEDSDPIALYARHVFKRGSLDDELNQAADFLAETRRPTCETILVYSNHDDFVRRWLNKPSDRIEVQNSKLYHRLNFEMREALDRGENVNIFEKMMRERAPDTYFTFATADDRCERFGTSFNFHGDKGVGGSRGSTVGLTRLGVSIAKAHDHAMTWREKVKSMGNLIWKADYATGPTCWTGAYLLVHCNGSTQMANMVGEKWRA